MRIRLSNKGLTFGDLQGIAFTLVLITALIAIGLYVNTQFQTQLPVGTFYNETVTFVNKTPNAPACTPITGVSRIMNTSHELFNNIGLGNWTSDTWTINVTILTMAGDLGFTLPWKVTYTCGNSSSYMVVKNATAGISNLSSWLPVIVVVLAAGIVIAAVVSWVSGRREL